MLSEEEKYGLDRYEECLTIAKKIETEKVISSNFLEKGICKRKFAYGADEPTDSEEEKFNVEYFFLLLDKSTFMTKVYTLLRILLIIQKFI